jgi:hypothetical protein
MVLAWEFELQRILQRAARSEVFYMVPGREFEDLPEAVGEIFARRLPRKSSAVQYPRNC